MDVWALLHDGLSLKEQTFNSSLNKENSSRHDSDTGPYFSAPRTATEYSLPKKRTFYVDQPAQRKI